jgi:hypothetical protein
VSRYGRYVKRDDVVVGTCEGCGLGVTEGDECPDCGAKIIWPPAPADRLVLEAEIIISEVEREGVADALSKLAALYKKGLLTEPEFATAKRRVLHEERE